MEKEFKTYKEQIRLLKSKGLTISDETHAVNTLKNTSYFALINGYKRPFKDINGNYLKEARFEDIENLYYFDEQLRFFTLQQLLELETRIKSSVSYHFSKNNKNVNAYFDVNNYDYIGRKIPAVNKLVSIFQDIHNDTSHSYITHYTQNHNGDIPLWVIINAMTFGQVSKMYSLLKDGEKQSICRDFGIKSQNDMGEILDILTLFRNVCAHNERLYDFKTQKQLGKQYIESYANCDPKADYDNIGKRLFGALAVCTYLTNDIKTLHRFKALMNSSSVIKDNRLKAYLIDAIGLPEGWLDSK